MVLPRDLVSRVQARVGTTLMGDKYRLDSVLGIGGMAAVYAATHRNAKRVAVKILHPELSSNFTICTHFQLEGYAANSVAHRGVVRVDDDDVTDDGTVFIVMELLEGVGVEALRLRNGGRLSVHGAVSITEQMLQVLSAAHQSNVVHRDIKPSNLFLLRDGSLKVLDFGIARVRDATRVGAAAWTGTGDLLGTPGFMAPEQAIGRSEAVDARTDLWAASATLFVLLSGELVHRGSNQQELRVCAARDPARALESVASSVPAAIARVVNRGLAMQRESRWPDATAMREALLDSYRSVFDRLPALVTHSEWDPPAAPVGGSLEATSVVVPVSPLLDASASDRPIALVPIEKKRTRRWLSWAPGIAMVMVAILAFVATKNRLRAASGHGSSPPVPVASREPSAVVLTEPAAAAAPVRVESSPEALPAPSLAPSPRVVAVGSPERTTKAVIGAQSKASGSHDCNPPTSVDSEGIKRPKPWCL